MFIQKSGVNSGTVNNPQELANECHGAAAQAASVQSGDAFNSMENRFAEDSRGILSIKLLHCRSPIGEALIFRHKNCETTIIRGTS